ncbi:hypothetical protein K7H20_19150 [Salipiger manganoxidans]|jgi:predicted methyltransferase|nr:hypothetical protein [Salipiger manganoxidans]
MRGLFVIPLLLATQAPAASPIAEVVCDAAPRMTDRLSRQFGARLTSTGLQGPDQVMELWTGPQGDWTMVIAYASGTSCIVAMGEHWSTLSPDSPEDPQDPA